MLYASFSFIRLPRTPGVRFQSCRFGLSRRAAFFHTIPPIKFATQGHSVPKSRLPTTPPVSACFVARIISIIYNLGGFGLGGPTEDHE